MLPVCWRRASLLTVTLTAMVRVEDKPSMCKHWGPGIIPHPQCCHIHPSIPPSLYPSTHPPIHSSFNTLTQGYAQGNTSTLPRGWEAVMHPCASDASQEQSGRINATHLPSSGDLGSWHKRNTLSFPLIPQKPECLSEVLKWMSALDG